MNIFRIGLLFFLYFSKTNIGLAFNSLINLEGEPKEKIIKLLSDPMINHSEKKIVALKHFMSGLDANEVRSMILPEINNFHELLALVGEFDDQENVEVLYKLLPFGPLARFFKSVEEILLSDNPDQISSFLDKFKFESIADSCTNPKQSLKQIIAELEVWNYMFNELSQQLTQQAVSCLNEEQLLSDSASYERIKSAASGSVIFDLGAVYLIKIREQLFEQRIYINQIHNDFWQQLQPELQRILEIFPFQESTEKSRIDVVIKDALNFIFIASQLASKISSVSGFASESIQEVDEWDEFRVLSFLKNIKIPDYCDRPLVQAKLNYLIQLVEAGTCDNMR